MTAKNTHILVIDQGTTSSRAIIFDDGLNAIASAQQEFRQHFPKSGWVEHDAEDIWNSVLDVCREALKRASLDASALAGIGITNQRETTVVWDRASGRPIANAIVWQDRRTADVCRSLQSQGHEALVAQTTGLRLDPYFSATKIAWLLDHTDGARERAERGELAFGTIDAFLLWRLTDGAVHATDATNASRTALFDINTQTWSKALLDVFNVPESLLPEVCDCAHEYGSTRPGLLGVAVPIRGVAGDQQAALIGQACFTPGMTKSTYGTGCFAIANTGDSLLRSSHQLLGTIGYRLNGVPTYALEGSIFVAGSAVQWLRDGVRMIDHAADTLELAGSNGVEYDVVVVPAFTGLGAPHWDPDARGAMFGLTRGTDRAAIVTATLQSIALQTLDLMRAMGDDGVASGNVRVDGGMVANNWFLQFLADITGCTIERPKNIESTALGAAGLAAIQAGIFNDLDAFSAVRIDDRSFSPSLPSSDVARLVDRWNDAVRRTRS
ncbi:MAG: glycerol kinase GlpK [Pseudomonadota bacterium]